MRFLLPLLLVCACTSHGKQSSTVVTTAERDAPLLATVGAISGVVHDAADGLPMPMVIVQAEAGGEIVAEDVSDHKGAYRVGPLPPGNYRLTARFANARVIYERVVVHKGTQTKVRVALDLRPQGDRSTIVHSEGRLGAIHGMVLDDVDGKSFPGAVVALHAKHLSEAVMAMADEEGRFRFKSLRPGVYSLSCYYQLVEQGNVEIRRGNIIVAPGETTTVQLQLDLRIR